MHAYNNTSYTRFISYENICIYENALPKTISRTYKYFWSIILHYGACVSNMLLFFFRVLEWPMILSNFCRRKYSVYLSIWRLVLCINFFYWFWYFIVYIYGPLYYICNIARQCKTRLSSIQNIGIYTYLCRFYTYKGSIFRFHMHFIYIKKLILLLNIYMLCMYII